MFKIYVLYLHFDYVTYMSSSLVDPFLSVAARIFESENGQTFKQFYLYFMYYHSSNEYRSHWSVTDFTFFSFHTLEMLNNFFMAIFLSHKEQSQWTEGSWFQ